MAQRIELNNAQESVKVNNKILYKWRPSFFYKMITPVLISTFAVFTLLVVLIVLPLWMLKKF